MNGVPSRLSPLHAVAGRAGAQFVPCAGWQVAQVYTSVEEEVVTAAQFAETSPFPGPEELYRGVYQDEGGG